MDPNATLSELRDLTQHARTLHDVRRAGELFAALDQWLSGGGALPTDWNKNRPAKADAVINPPPFED